MSQTKKRDLTRATTAQKEEEVGCVYNPLTNRKIVRGGAVHTKLIRQLVLPEESLQGGWQPKARFEGYSIPENTPATGAAASAAKPKRPNRARQVRMMASDTESEVEPPRGLTRQPSRAPAVDHAVLAALEALNLEPTERNVAAMEARMGEIANRSATKHNAREEISAADTDSSDDEEPTVTFRKAGKLRR